MIITDEYILDYIKNNTNIRASRELQADMYKSFKNDFNSYYRNCMHITEAWTIEDWEYLMNYPEKDYIYSEINLLANYIEQFKYDLSTMNSYEE